MEIKVEHSNLFYGGTYHHTVDLKFIGDFGYIQEDFGEEEVKNLVVSLVEDTILYKCYPCEVVGKLIEAGIITHEQILEYVAESGDEE